MLNHSPTIFDAAVGRELRDAGIAQAASWPHDEPIARARSIAIMLATRNGETHADAVYEYLSEKLPEVLEQIPPNGWGSVFKTSRLKFSGRVRESGKFSRHSGIQRIWVAA